MSQSSAAAPPPPEPVTASSPAPAPTSATGAGIGVGAGQTQGAAGRPPRARDQATHAPTSAAELAAARGIPAFLVRLRLVAAAALLLFTALAVGQLVLGVQAAEQAAADARQVIRVQDLKADLLRADALATNAFLIGGLEPSDRRLAYDAAIADATKQIAAAAQAQPADQAALSELSALVVRYAADMDVARANNRQGLPVGAAYLRSASAQMRDRGIALVDALLEANTARAQQSLGDQHPVWALIPGVLALGVLVWANAWMARRFRRRFNIGVTIAALAVTVITAGVVGASAVQAMENSALSRGDYRQLLSAADARSAANVAKSSESLRLIARGSGKVFEDTWTNHAKTVSTSVPNDLANDWKAYAAAHRDVVAKDDAGDWDGAVLLATAEDQGTSPLFTTFDDRLAERVGVLSDRVNTTLASGARTPLVVAVVAVLLGLGAMWGAWSGVSRRLEEYS